MVKCKKLSHSGSSQCKQHLRISTQLSRGRTTKKESRASSPLDLTKLSIAQRLLAMKSSKKSKAVKGEKGSSSTPPTGESSGFQPLERLKELVKQASWVEESSISGDDRISAPSFSPVLNENVSGTIVFEDELCFPVISQEDLRMAKVAQSSQTAVCSSAPSSLPPSRSPLDPLSEDEAFEKFGQSFIRKSADKPRANDIPSGCFCSHGIDLAESQNTVRDSVPSSVPTPPVSGICVPTPSTSTAQVIQDLLQRVERLEDLVS